MKRLRSFCLLPVCVLTMVACKSDPAPADQPTPSGDSADDPAVDPTADPAADPTADPAADPAADPTGDPAADPAADPTGDPLGDPTADPIADPSADPEADSPCEPGFALSDTGCVDIDECTGSPCSEHATCENTEGSFTCTCNEGFTGDGLECTSAACAPGEPFTFTKRNGREGEDCITENVCLTRGANGPLYNSAREPEADRNGCDTLSPVGVEFARGFCEGNPGPFRSLRNARGCESMGLIREERLCMHLVEDDLWFNVTWHSFTGGGEGGGFSYTRTLVGGDPCGVSATCSVGADGTIACACPAGTEGDPESFCR